MNFFKRKSGGPWYVVYTSAGGKRIRRSTGVTSKPRAREIAMRWLSASEGDDRDTALRSTMSLDEAFGRYWDEHVQHLNSARTSFCHMKLLISWFGADTTLSSISHDEVSRFVMQQRRRVSPSTVNRYLQCMRALMNMARKRWGVRVAEVDWGAHTSTEPDSRDICLTRDEAAQLIRHAVPHLQPIIRFALMTALRKADILGLQWDQIDLSARVMLFHVKSTRPGGKTFFLPITDEVEELLRSLGPKTTGPVFTYEGHGIVNTRRSFATACRKAGIEGFVFHGLRHTAATWMVEAGVPLDVVQKTLGHEDIRTTQRYARRSVDDVRRAMGSLALTQDQTLVIDR